MKTDKEILDWLEFKSSFGEHISIMGSEIMVGRRYVGNPFDRLNKPPLRELLSLAMQSDERDALMRDPPSDAGEKPA